MYFVIIVRRRCTAQQTPQTASLTETVASGLPGSKERPVNFTCIPAPALHSGQLCSGNQKASGTY